MKLLPFPVKVLESIQKEVAVTYSNYSTKHQAKLQQILCDLWMRIYTLHLEYVETNADDNFAGADPHLIYVGIPRKSFLPFKIKINNHEFQYSKLIQLLETCGVIEINNKYSSGAFSKSYRIPVDQFTETTFITISTQKIFNNFRGCEYWTAKYPEHKSIIEEAYMSSIDIDSYYQWIDSNIGSLLSSKTKKGFIVDQYLTNSKAYSLKIGAIKFNFKNFWFMVSSTGRFYNTISNLNKVAVPFLLINDRPTDSLDAKNSQPLLLSKLVDCKAYSKDVENGEFYDKMAFIIGKTRTEFKILSYRWIFFNDKPIPKKYCEALDSLYNGLSAQINKIKADSKLWFELQSLESSIWVETAKQLPFPKLIRHDQLVFESQWKSVVAKKLIDAYKKAGMQVTLD